MGFGKPLQSHWWRVNFSICGPHLVDQINLLTGLTNPDVNCWIEPEYCLNAEMPKAAWDYQTCIISTIIELEDFTFCCYPEEEWGLWETQVV